VHAQLHRCTSIAAFSSLASLMVGKFGNAAWLAAEVKGASLSLTK
jgi:hypothetical protein